MSDQEIHCLLTLSSIKIGEKYETPTNPTKTGNGVLQLIVVGNSIQLKSVGIVHAVTIVRLFIQSLTVSG